MTKTEFLGSVNAPFPPEGIDLMLESLWYDAKGDWDKAHEIVQNISSKAAARIHAYLHRKEGDILYAEYWYTKAEIYMPEAEASLAKEWEEIVDYIFEIPERSCI